MGKLDTATCGDIEATGRTATEAKERLMEKCGAALSGDFRPRVIAHNGQTAIAWREPHGWTYRILPMPGAEDIVRRVEYASGCGEYAKVIAEATFHLLDVSSGPEEFQTDADIPEMLADAGLRDTLLGNAKFRRSYIKAKEARPDLDSTAWHRMAGAY